ncbi:MAG: HNH endonuclease [Betaproteobacteria bacterium]|nr:HNH endonuclease [Betaproteobacteria bacterium]
MSEAFAFAAPPSALVRKALRYDPDTGLFTWVSTRGNSKAGTVAGYVVPRAGYIKIGFEDRLFFAHRLAWLFSYDQWPDHFIDHKNGIRTDNRISNLRRASIADNNRNRRPEGRCRKGVTQHKHTGRFHALIAAEGKRHFLGSFATEAEAYAAYCEAAHRLHGEFARVA